MINPSEGVRKVFIEIIQNDNENANKNFEYSDKFITWIIGFSIAGISLLLSNSDVKELAGGFYFHVIIYLIAFSAITGIAYRWFSRKYTNEYYKATMYLLYFINYKDYFNKLTDEAYLNTLEDLKIALEKDFDLPAEPILSLLKISYTEDEDLIRELRKFYEDAKKWYLKEIEDLTNKFQLIYKDAYGISDKKMEKEKEYSNRKIKLFRKISNTLFFSSLLSFLLAFVVIIFSV